LSFGISSVINGADGDLSKRWKKDKNESDYVVARNKNMKRMKALENLCF
jgi:hypothetical protein